MRILPTLRQLRYLVAVAEQKHFGRAAEFCFVTQSTLSSGIQDLERLLNCTLLERSTRRQVMLTPLGEDIVTRARSLLRDAEEIADVADSHHSPLTGRLRLGVIPTIGPYFLPKALPDVRRAYPDLKLYLREDKSDRLVEGLQNGRLDCAILAMPYPVSDFHCEFLGQDLLLLAAPDGHSLVKAGVVLPEQLEDEDVLMLEDGHCLRDHALGACAGHSLRSNEAVQATSLSTLVQMVANGLGVTLIPEMSVPMEAHADSGVVAVPFSEPYPARGIALIWRMSSPRHDELILLANVLKAHLHEGLKT